MRDPCIEARRYGPKTVDSPEHLFGVPIAVHSSYQYPSSRIWQKLGLEHPCSYQDSAAQEHEPPRAARGRLRVGTS